MDEQAPASFKVWRCLGCGRMEMPATCIGVCQDRALELVEAEAYERLAADYRAMRELVLRLARTEPRDGKWREGYQALQARAKTLLADQFRR